MNDTELAKLHFKNYLLKDVTFKGGNLSKLDFSHVKTGPSYLKFEDTTLPKTMEGSAITTLILKNIYLPELDDLIDISDALPHINDTLKVYNIKNKILEKWDEQTIKQNAVHRGAPEKYVGPKDVWDKLKLLYDVPPETKTHFTNEDKTDVDIDDIQFTSLNKKPQSPVLLALLQGKANHTRG